MLTNILKNFNPRRLTAWSGLIILALTLFLGRGQAISWASPNQDPQRQTVPPRTPTFTPSPTSTSPAPAPTVEPSPSSLPKTDDGDDSSKGGATLPTPLPNPGAGPGTEESPAAPLPSGPDDENNRDELPLPGQPGPQPEETPVSPNPANKTGEDQLAAEPADLSLTKTATNRTAKMGSVITFTVTVRNDGPGSAANIVVRDRVPSQMALNSFWPSQGMFNPGTGHWTIGAIFPGQVVTLSVVVTVMDVGVVTNTAEIMAAASFDPDSTPGNSLEGEDDQASAAIASSQAGSSNPAAPDSIEPLANSAAGSKLSTIPGGSGWLNWLYAFILGILLILVGLFLVNRA